MFNEYFKKSKTCIFLGTPLDEFSRDELLAICAYAIHDAEVQKKDYERRFSFMRQLDKMRDNAISGL